MQYQIIREVKLALDCLRVEVPLEVLVEGVRPVPWPFVFDTGCEVSMVSEDEAAALRLPSGGRPTSVTAVLTGGKGRIVPVRFRFADIPGVEIDTEWVVVAGRSNV